MKNSTLKTDIKFYESALRKHFDYNSKSENTSLKIQFLNTLGNEYPIATWRRFKALLIFYEQKMGNAETVKEIKDFKYPLSVEERNKKFIKTSRCKKVNEEDRAKIFEASIHDKSVYAAVKIADMIGARPSEIPSLEFTKSNLVIITGAKKTEDGLRGIDRWIRLPEDDYFELSRLHRDLLLEVKKIKEEEGEEESEAEDEYIKKKERVRQINERAMRRIQDRLSTITKKLFPRRKARPTLYSFRHQLGSDLKASSFDRVKIAAIMGHASVDSVDSYGDRRSASGRKLDIDVSDNSLEKVRKKTLKVKFKNSDHIGEFPNITSGASANSDQKLMSLPEAKSTNKIFPHDTYF